VGDVYIFQTEFCIFHLTLYMYCFKPAS